MTVFVKQRKKFGVMRSAHDTRGSYTGTPAQGDRPEQDADDL